MKLKELIQKSKIEVVKNKPLNFESAESNPLIDSICSRSSEAKQGSLFIAVKGFRLDGHDYIDEALRLGANAIISEKQIDKQLPVIIVNDSREALSKISAAFFNNPSERLFLIGITGTNGKTTVAYLTENILIASGKNTGVIGTVNLRYGGKVFSNPVTTPESIDLQRAFFEMRESGVSHVVMEVSSHAIDLYRINNCAYDICVFTNLTHDHLDYHSDINSYWACKKRLFTEHLAKGIKSKNATAIINCNNNWGKELYNTLEITKISVGFNKNDFISIKTVEYSISGIGAEIKTPIGNFEFTSHLIGKHNLENILCAVGIGIAMGVSLKHIKQGIENTKRVPGRLESILNNSNKHIFIDYAHTPDALENVLSSLKQLGAKRIILVFGCGGDRDKKKRHLMGKIAGKLCDMSIITSDNPRSEDPDKIISQITEGIRTETKSFIVEPDREKGIEAGIKELGVGDILLIAGKGHETYQIIGNRILDVDDRKIVEEVLSRNI